MTYGSLGGGILSGAIRKLETYAAGDSRNRFYKHFQEPTFSKIMKVLETMDQISAARGQVALSQIAINWAAQKPFVSTCIVGAQTRRKIEGNAAGFSWELTEAELAHLDAVIERYLGEAQCPMTPAEPQSDFSLCGSDFPPDRAGKSSIDIFPKAEALFGPRPH